MKQEYFFVYFFLYLLKNYILENITDNFFINTKPFTNSGIYATVLAKKNRTEYYCNFFFQALNRLQCIGICGGKQRLWYVLCLNTFSSTRDKGSGIYLQLKEGINLFLALYHRLAYN